MSGDYSARLSRPGVREFFEIVVRIEALVLRPTSQRPEDILDLAEALAHAARAAQEPDGCECGPNAICADHLCPCGCGDPELTRGAQESLDAYRHRVVEHDRAYIRRKIGGGT